MRRDVGPPPPMLANAEPFPFVRVQGPGVYEILVGPVHAGLIEPGHLRFSVAAETIIKMKARLWFLHRGIERLFQGPRHPGGVELAERVSGDSAVAHNLAYCLAAEDACQITIGEDAARLRAMLLELERLYNHVADIGALCNDVGFGLAQARALTLRERLLRLNAEITGHRLLRGAIRPGHTAVLRLPGAAELAEIGRHLDDLTGLATLPRRVLAWLCGPARRAVTGQESQIRPPAADAGHRRNHGRMRPDMPPGQRGEAQHAYHRPHRPGAARARPAVRHQLTRCLAESRCPPSAQSFVPPPDDVTDRAAKCP
jgi:hypothetical protein